MGTRPSSARVRCPRYARAGTIRARRDQARRSRCRDCYHKQRGSRGREGSVGTPLAGKLPDALDAAAGMRPSPPPQACARAGIRGSASVCAGGRGRQICPRRSGASRIGAGSRTCVRPALASLSGEWRRWRCGAALCAAIEMRMSELRMGGCGDTARVRAPWVARSTRWCASFRGIRSRTRDPRLCRGALLCALCSLQAPLGG